MSAGGPVESRGGVSSGYFLAGFQELNSDSPESEVMQQRNSRHGGRSHVTLCRAGRARRRQLHTDELCRCGISGNRRSTTQWNKSILFQHIPQTC